MLIYNSQIRALIDDPIVTLRESRRKRFSTPSVLPSRRLSIGQHLSLASPASLGGFLLHAFVWITIGGAATLASSIFLHTNILEGHPHRTYSNRVPNFVKVSPLFSIVLLLLYFDDPRDPWKGSNTNFLFFRCANL